MMDPTQPAFNVHDMNMDFRMPFAPKVIIPNSVKYIGRRAFDSCSNLKEIVIPKSITTITDDTFSGCNNLTAIYSLNPIPPSLENGTFDTVIYTTATLYVPHKAVEAYRTADGWKAFHRIEGINSQKGKTRRAK